MNELSLDQRLAALAARYASDYAADWRGGVPGWIYEDKDFQFSAEGLVIEVRRIEDGWEYRVTTADGVVLASNGPDDRSALSETAMRDAWIDFTRLVRADDWEHDREDGDLFLDALRVVMSAHAGLTA